jgi:hypothetical protein
MSEKGAPAAGKRKPKRAIRSLIQSAIAWYDEDPGGATDAILEGLLSLDPERVWSWVIRKADENRSAGIQAGWRAAREAKEKP